MYSAGVYKEPQQRELQPSSSAACKPSSAPSVAGTGIEGRMKDENSPTIDDVPRMQDAKEEGVAVHSTSSDEDDITSDESADSVAVDSTSCDEGIWECSACTFINESPLHLTCDVCGAPKYSYHDVPRMQTARDGATNQPEIMEDDEAPFRISEIAAAYKTMDKAAQSTKKNSVINADTTIMPGEDAEYLSANISHEEDRSGHSTEIHHHSTQTHVPTESNPPLTAERGNEQCSLNSDRVELRIRPTPQSMLPCPNEEPSISSAPMLEATCVEESPLPVYDAFAVQDNNASFWKRHQKYIFVGLVALVLGAMTAIIASVVSSQNKEIHVDDETGSIASIKPLYLANRDNNRCDSYSPGQPNTRETLFTTIEECCRTVFWLRGNECMLNSLQIHRNTPTAETASTTTTYSSTSSTTNKISSAASTTTSITSSTATSTTASTPTTPYSNPPSTSSNLSLGPQVWTQQRPSKQPTKRPTPMPTESSHISAGPKVWRQQGQTIVGDAAGDEAGRSVALSGDGKTLAIGAPGNWTDDRRGYVKVYHRQVIWKQLGLDMNGQLDGDNLGQSLSLSSNGRILAIGAPGYWEKKDRPGYVRFYYMEGADLSWRQLVAIGANTNNDNGEYSGQVKVYHIDHIGTDKSWKQLGQEINGEAAYDNSGRHVALSGDGNTLAIGAHWNDGNGENSGRVRIYEVRDDGNSPIWEQVGQDIDGEASNDEAGASVALSSDGKTLAMGAPGSDNNNDRAGYVRVYHRNSGSSSGFQQIGKDTIGEAPKDRFGMSVDLSQDGKTLAVGANNNDHDNGHGSGHVRVYHMEGSNSQWAQLGQDVNGEKAGDQAGWRVSLSANGKTLAISSHWNSDNGDKSGHVRVFGIDE